MVPTSDRTLRDPHQERRLDREGYVVISGAGHDLLPRLREIADGITRGPSPPEPEGAAPAWETMTAPGGAWELSLNQLDPAEQRAVVARAADSWSTILAEHFVDHRVVVTAFLYKHPGEDGVLPLHQDPTIVDEAERRSVTVWIPLDEISARRDNGALRVLAGSHRVARDLRGTGTVAPYLDHLERLWPHTEEIDVDAGDLVVLDSRVVHGSPPNRSDRVRRVMSGVVVPRDAPLCHVIAREQEIQIIDTDDEFYDTYNPRALHERPPADRPVRAVIATGRPRPRIARLALTSRWHRLRRRVATRPPSVPSRS